MLYIVATPIGNLKDLSVRAREVLEGTDYLLCEDTRVTALMLKNLNIESRAKLISFYDEIEEQKMPEVIGLLENGVDVALVSDAGTPTISDPGYRLVKRCRELGLNMTAVPGPSAVVNALVLSGLPGGRFSFLGFLPKKNNDRMKVLEEFFKVGGSKIVYESPFRVGKLIDEIRTVYGEETKVVICREMTKMYEEIISGSALELSLFLKKRKLKGELVVVFC